MPAGRGTVTALIQSAAVRLAKSGLPNAALDAETLYRGATGLTRAEVLSRPDESAGEGLAARFEAALARRERQEPIQYILGTAAFWRDEFLVTTAVLIPRPETEILVEAVAARLQGHTAPRIVDIGTGSGCIALSLLRELPEARATAVDISVSALTVAAHNASRLGLSQRIEFRQSSWLAALTPSETLDAIVSNPPYVARSDEAALPADVREYEPALALFAQADDDLSSYRAIVAGLDSHLSSGGLLAVEVGMGQSDRVARLFAASGLARIEVLPDLAQIPRVVLGFRS